MRTRTRILSKGPDACGTLALTLILTLTLTKGADGKICGAKAAAVLNRSGLPREVRVGLRLGLGFGATLTLTLSFILTFALTQP